MESNKKGSDKNVGSMEEVIKLVESLIKEFEVYGDLDAFEDIRPYMKAIEHLIKAYKEEKEKNNKLYNENVNLYNKKEVEVYNKGIENANSFWISKIKEKIEELNKLEKYNLKGLKGADRCFVKQTYNSVRNSLEELLEDK